MTARGKCEAKRSTSPLVNQDHTRSRPERPKYTPAITPFQGCIRFIVSYQGRRASRLPLAFISRAVGAFISRRWRFHRAVGPFISCRWLCNLEEAVVALDGPLK